MPYVSLTPVVKIVTGRTEQRSHAKTMHSSLHARAILLSLAWSIWRACTMKRVNMLEAKTQLSKLVSRIERGEEHEIIIARNGRPAARLVPLQARTSGKRIGLLKGRFKAPSLDELDRVNTEIEHLFSDTP